MHYQELKTAWDELTAPGAPFELVVQEVRGTPLKVFKNAPPNVRAIWLSTAAFADRTYLVFENERITYAEAHILVASIANWLHAHGVKRGDRVAIAMRNFPEWMLIYWACVSVGVTVVGMNAWWTAEEMSYGFKDAQPKVAFVDPERMARIAERPEMVEGISLVAVRAPATAGYVAWSDVIATGGTMPVAEIDPDDDACIFYTSGTTGFPKGAQLTHRGCVANLFNMMFSGQAQALATQRATGVAPDPNAPVPVPIALLTTPLFHVTANNCGAYATTAAGGTIVLMYKWDAGEALRIIEAEKVTSMSGVPTMAREVLTHPDFASRDTSSLLSLGGGGAQVPPDLVHKIDAQVKTARPNTGYGMTETCGIITAIAADFFVDRPDSAGPAMPAFEARCVDDEGDTVPLGQVGELWVRGSPVIKGYINRPEATAETITDGWLHTGDIARMDEDGFIYIVDRKKDMVLRGGENIYCAEVEANLYRHPAVAECSVFGVPDERLGEEVGVAIVLRPGHSATPDELREHCASIAAKHKTPRYIWIREEALPRNASGKFLKRELRDTLRLEDAG
ncbi:class I adenylate-forming enzyme family protein [Phenylobacterium sp.]|uniref:class I adenylate-forming enzyme family protein n=1 Tax=Phenylobacterium sp. TaxID=1871053 RepID=UPI0025F87636|nr:class I adenylate-forming enzyme family protein [Phenylobacterium sp.]MCA6287555.1 acyl--CoA ligase [Phenylobacterium sp.]MCA6309832.1 acyl--CoA ligase [Phenylobacterium sp.]MCA6322685.1 acyl--CoA ligase [Phenylobacterium sp.]MCA6336058.1 acyl--CoA ligase [Phenylobacterium sp.]MCA6338803.1 acyl--CoA ligase [Phenylobacterium sp.]